MFQKDRFVDDRKAAVGEGQRAAQDGLWFMAGSLAQCRTYSKYLALQIKALEEGLAGAPS